jgi:hypothetical protein
MPGGHPHPIVIMLNLSKCKELLDHKNIVYTEEELREVHDFFKILGEIMMKNIHTENTLKTNNHEKCHSLRQGVDR